MPERIRNFTVQECHRRAAEAEKLAAAAADPAEKQDLLAVSEKWLALGREAELELQTKKRLKQRAGW
jgi:hypothetical protein